MKSFLRVILPDLWNPPRGAGDVVAAVAQPIARVIDRVAGTRVAECGGCKKRHEALNRAIPFSLPEGKAEDSQ